MLISMTREIACAIAQDAAAAQMRHAGRKRWTNQYRLGNFRRAEDGDFDLCDAQGGPGSS